MNKEEKENLLSLNGDLNTEELSKFFKCLFAISPLQKNEIDKNLNGTQREEEEKKLVEGLRQSLNSTNEYKNLISNHARECIIYKRPENLRIGKRKSASEFDDKRKKKKGAPLPPSKFIHYHYFRKKTIHPRKLMSLWFFGDASQDTKKKSCKTNKNCINPLHFVVQSNERDRSKEIHRILPRLLVFEDFD